MYHLQCFHFPTRHISRQGLHASWVRIFFSIWMGKWWQLVSKATIKRWNEWLQMNWHLCLLSCGTRSVLTVFVFLFTCVCGYIWSRFAVRYHPPPPWYGPKTCVLQHSAWKRVICSVFCTVGGWRGPQTCKFVGFLQPAFRKRVICNVSASTSWSSAVAPPSMSSGHIILNRLI